MKICQITGKRAQNGNNVSHSNAKTKRKFAPNLKTKRLFLEEEGRFVSVRLSAAALRTINKNGLAATLRSAKAMPKVY